MKHLIQQIFLKIKLFPLKKYLINLKFQVKNLNKKISSYKKLNNKINN